MWVDAVEHRGGGRHREARRLTATLVAAAIALAVVAGCASGASPTPEGATLEPADFEIVSKDIAFSTFELTVPADLPFTILHRNEDRGVPHDIDIRTADGTVLVDTPTIDGGQAIIYRYPALAAGTYVFICSVHPIPAMTGTLVAR